MRVVFFLCSFDFHIGGVLRIDPESERYGWLCVSLHLYAYYIHKFHPFIGVNILIIYMFVCCWNG